MERVLWRSGVGRGHDCRAWSRVASWGISVLDNGGVENPPVDGCAGGTKGRSMAPDAKAVIQIT